MRDMPPDMPPDNYDLGSVIERIDSHLQNENNIQILENVSLLPQLSLPQSLNATVLIKNFFNLNLNYICFGSSSSGYCSHILFRRNNKVYVVYIRMTSEITAYYLTRQFLIDIFVQGGTDVSIPEYYN